ncbi:uncharacterized protein BO80DRAFT_254852 [Aspergillus ibericus CBS 121593]|uniref:Uncharacterized protein n=1 Tax=Aspergillus ibericus CBS 121593 TaxID=1448316 RepID=A0A395HCW3_9EURO|nr:hypothetical protein BO80DRAFT_254852 [Aspergillus ibericus CBS 121593]RAL04054.1 hypothetical protein BO80DRAFT_254852 [Aspergillus ibericus CBS 121593]
MLESPEEVILGTSVRASYLPSGPVYPQDPMSHNITMHEDIRGWGPLGPLFSTVANARDPPCRPTTNEQTDGTWFGTHGQTIRLVECGTGLDFQLHEARGGEEARETREWRRRSDLETGIYPIYHMAVNLAAAHGDPRHSGCHLLEARGRGGALGFQEWTAFYWRRERVCVGCYMDTSLSLDRNADRVRACLDTTAQRLMDADGHEEIRSGIA